MARKAKGIGICSEVRLPADLRLDSAYKAIAAFPPNAPLGNPEPGMIAVRTGKWWGKDASDLTVGFIEQTTPALRDMVLSFANSWSEFTNVRFRWTQTSPIIRVSFLSSGYWSYLGRDCLSIPANQPTLNLEAFTVRTPVSEWNRVVKHEFGHALGCPHEQQRAAILALLDPAKTIAYFRRTQGWSEQEVREQILTPLEEQSIMGSPVTDVSSIMCYQFPGSITKSGKPIPGGLDFSSIDREFMAKVYPKAIVEPPPGPPPATGEVAVVVGLDGEGREVFRFKR